MPFYIPHVIEIQNGQERGYNIFDRLMKDRIIMLGSEIDDDVAQVVVGMLLFLESQDPEKDVSLYINSPGGSVSAGLAIYDTMQYVKCPISTICLGQAASMGAVLLAAGTKGKRFALPHSRVMIHQPLGGARGQATDMQIQVNEILRYKKQLNSILEKHTGQSLERIEKDTDRDYFISPEEARSYGLIDEVLVHNARKSDKEKR